LPEDNSTPSGNLAPDNGNVIPRIKLSETGYLGLVVNNGQILAESNKAFQYPNFIKTINEMRNNPTVGAAMNVYRFMMTRPKWYVSPPVGADSKMIERANIVNSMMHDMDEPFSTFIENNISYLEYGFSISEIVLRRRLKRNGSIHYFFQYTVC